MSRTLQFFWFRAAIKFYNGMLSSFNTTLEQVLDAYLKLEQRVKTRGASDVFRAFEGLPSCNTYKQAFL